MCWIRHYSTLLHPIVRCRMPSRVGKARTRMDLHLPRAFSLGRCEGSKYRRTACSLPPRFEDSPSAEDCYIDRPKARESALRLSARHRRGFPDRESALPSRESHRSTPCKHRFELLLRLSTFLSIEPPLCLYVVPTWPLPQSCRNHSDSDDVDAMTGGRERTSGNS